MQRDTSGLARQSCVPIKVLMVNYGLQNRQQKGEMDERVLGYNFGKQNPENFFRKGQNPESVEIR